MNLFSRLLPLLIISASLVGCATTGAPQHSAEGSPSAEWQRQKAYLYSVDNWDMSARAGNGSGFSGSLNWDQQDDESWIRIRGPLGIGAIEVLGNADQVLLKDRQGSRIVLNPEQVLAEQYGLPIAIDHLRWWALGLAAPQQSGQYLFDDDGRPSDIYQNGWHVVLDSYQRYGCGVVLPRKIKLNHAGHKMKLVLSSWQSPEPSCKQQQQDWPTLF